jgi:hypothetical protein
MFEGIILGCALASLTLGGCVIYLLSEISRERRERQRLCQEHEAERRALVDRLLMSSGVPAVHQPMAEQQGTTRRLGHRTLRDRQRDMQRKILEDQAGLTEGEKDTLLAAVKGKSGASLGAP